MRADKKFKRTNKLLARMQELAAQDNKSLYERTCLAKEVMDDIEWIAANHNGSESAAIEYLTYMYFPHHVGNYTVGQLLEILEYYPEEKDWEKHGFHLREMYDKIPQEKKERRKADGPSKSQLREENHQLKLEVAQLKALVAQLRAQIAELRAELAKHALEAPMV